MNKSTNSANQPNEQIRKCMDERMNEQKLELELRPAEDIEGVTRMAEEQAYNDTQRWGQAVQVALGRMRHKHRIYEVRRQVCMYVRRCVRRQVCRHRRKDR
eukprot:GHVU01021283.1.p2 GENE.GHVU01021283.1~~GHVU01021283.1.p2  ORF type:complete len:101 (+),score=6.87 GHVU01021283.1:786-1088(+)